MAALDEANLRRMYLGEGWTMRQIAEALETSPAMIRRALVRWGIPCRRHGPRYEMPLVTKELRVALRARVAVLGVGRTANRLGMSPQTIHRILGTRPLPRGVKPSLDDQVVRRAYAAQMAQPGSIRTTCVVELAAQFGCSPRTIWRSLQRTRGEDIAPSAAVGQECKGNNCH